MRRIVQDMANQRILYGIMTAGSATGIVAAFLQTLEKIQLLEHAHDALVCDVNSVFSCTNVLNAWQSSVFGFPNSLFCLVLFVIFGTIAVAGLCGARLPVRLRLGIHALSLFTLGFAIWFLSQSIYAIHALCILCIFCFAGLLLVNGSWLRLNAEDLPIGDHGRRFLSRSMASGADIFGWFLLAALLAFAAVLRFR